MKRAVDSTRSRPLVPGMPATRASAELRRSRADLVRQAIEYYLDDFEDLRRAIEVLRDPADPVLDWRKVRDDRLRLDEAQRAQDAGANRPGRPPAPGRGDRQATHESVGGQSIRHQREAGYLPDD